MKLHHLSITGIGPYSGTETIDFEPLNEAGVHLLTGPTGSGKTTVLDAISYGLFGQIPRSAKGAEVVSDHRKIETRPQVVVDLTVGGSRLRVTRSPEHERPKARGEGTANEGQSVKLELHRDNEWHPLSDRWREANIELEERVGMNADQFSQVVMLPQGEFAKFLRSDARSRQELLEKLFPGNDLTFVENWLKSRAAEDGEKRAATNREIANSIERVRPIIDSAIENEVDGITEIPELSEAPPVISWIESTGRRLAALADAAEKARIVAADASGLSEREAHRDDPAGRSGQSKGGSRTGTCGAGCPQPVARNAQGRDRLMPSARRQSCRCSTRQTASPPPQRRPPPDGTHSR